MGADNKLNALSIVDYGGVADYTYTSGTMGSGTDNTGALNSMMTAAAEGQLMIIPEGKWYFASKPNDWKDKRMNLLVLGDTYHNSVDFIKIVAPTSGADRMHRFEHQGRAVGREGMPSHTKTNYDNGTGPNWASFTGIFYQVVNNSKNYASFNYVTGFASAVSIIGGGGLGSQENKVEFRWFYKNAVCINLKSTDGSSYVDKNFFFGGRVSGGTAIEVDGYASSSPDPYNGAFRANVWFNVLIEQCDIGIVMNGDCTYNSFIGCKIEGGVNTGVFGPTKISLRQTGANICLGTSIVSMEFLYASWLTGDIGVNTSIVTTPIFLEAPTYALLGHQAIGGAAGRLSIVGATSLSATARGDIPANIDMITYTNTPSTDIQFAYEVKGGVERAVLYERADNTVTTSSYTVTGTVGMVYVNYTGGTATITLPSASTYPRREVTVKNIHASNTVNISGAVAGETSSLTAKQAITYRSNGTGWYVIAKG